MNPASFLVNAKGYAPYYNYSFIDNSSRIEGMERFFRRIDLLSLEMIESRIGNKQTVGSFSFQPKFYDQEDLGFFHKSRPSFHPFGILRTG